MSKATGRKYWIRSNSTCTTKNVIYLAYCTKCGEQEWVLLSLGNLTYQIIRVTLNNLSILAKY